MPATTTPEPAVAVPTNVERRRLTVVFNPMKVDDLDGAKAVVAEVCNRHGWADPTWVETTEDETGEKQGREAVDSGADVVASLGGDGTVRAVASALVGSNVALGLLPGGTGNLLARNLGLPVDDLGKAVEAMVAGADRRIDVGLVRVGDALMPVGEGDERADDEEVFLVMTGLGLDGEIMAGTNEKVKGLLGWPAYVLSAAKQLASRGFSAQVDSVATPGSSPGSAAAAGAGSRSGRGSVGRHARTVIVGNCGTLQGGMQLMPDAEVDDGVLDLIVVAPHGFFGWVSVMAAIATRHRKGHSRMDRLRSTGFTIVAKHPVEAEIDGDPIGEKRALMVRVLPDSLVVRVG